MRTESVLLQMLFHSSCVFSRSAAVFHWPPPRLVQSSPLSIILDRSEHNPPPPSFCLSALRRERSGLDHSKRSRVCRRRRLFHTSAILRPHQGGRERHYSIIIVKAGGERYLWPEMAAPCLYSRGGKGKGGQGFT